MSMIKENHLGGFVEERNSRCFYTELWDQLIKDFSIKSVIDVGCGQGHALAYLKEKGCKIFGIDGSALVLKDNPLGLNSEIHIHDYTEGAYKPFYQYDLAWSCEFVEHVEEKFIPNFMTTFKSAKIVALSHALPGQGGYHHVNEQTDDYWIGKFLQNGFKLHIPKTTEYRALAHDYFQKSGLVFTNESTNF